MRHAASILVVPAVVAAVFWPVHGFEFLGFDDDIYFTSNVRLQSGLTLENIRWAFTTGHHSNWHPVTWLTVLLDYQLFGEDPGAMHVVNALYHAANAVLLYLLLLRMTAAWAPALAVAVLFAVHPLHVESVAWISERKDVVSTLFWLLTTRAYVAYAARPAKWRMALAAGLLALGLMAKPMLVTLPFTLLLFDYWPLKRLQRRAEFKARVIEKWPLFAVALASAVVTFAVQHAGGAVRTLLDVPLAARIGNVPVAYLLYLAKTIWPSRLAAFYPHPGESIGILWPLIALAILLWISYAVWRLADKAPYWVTGWLWYLGTLVPVLGIVQVGNQAMADRYTYVPLIGIFIAAAWTVHDAVRERPAFRYAAAVGSVLIAAVLVVVAHRQALHWRTSETLWRHAIAVTEDNYTAYNSLGAAVAPRDLDEAERLFRKAWEIEPNTVGIYLNLGNVHLIRGRIDEALAAYTRAVQQEPERADTHAALGRVLLRLGRAQEAAERLARALELDPYHALAGDLYPEALTLAGDYARAVTEYRKVLRRRPDDFAARGNLAVALLNLGRYDEALELLNGLLRDKPDHVEALHNVGVIRSAQGKTDEARRIFERVLELKPDHEVARRNLERLAP